jgi:hypothetical protein
VIQEGKETIALFIEPFADGFFVRFATGRLQQLKGFVFEGLTQIIKDFQAKESFLLLECDGGSGLMRSPTSPACMQSVYVLATQPSKTS